MNQANRPAGAQGGGWQTVTSRSTSGDCGHAAAWQPWPGAGQAGHQGRGVSAPRLGSRGHVGPWVAGLAQACKVTGIESEAVPPQLAGLDFSELLTPAKPLLPREPTDPAFSLSTCPSPHSGSFPSAAGLCGELGECPAWAACSWMDGQGPCDLSPLILPPWLDSGARSCPIPAPSVDCGTGTSPEFPPCASLS